MKLHLPTDLRNAVMACITALGGIAATGTTGTLAIGVALASTAQAATYTPDSSTHTISETLTTGDVINLSGNGIGIAGTDDSPGGTSATLNFADNNTGVTLNATSGTCIWNVTQASYDNNAGVTTVNVSADATLNVYNTVPQSPAFNKKAGTSATNPGASLNITLGTRATLCSVWQIFGWFPAQSPDTNKLAYPGKRTLNMGEHSTWEITLNKNESKEWLNNTTVVMNHATINIANGKTLSFERNHNAIKTTETASGMSVIKSVNSEQPGTGKLEVGGKLDLESIGNYSGCLFEVQRGDFTFDDTNTADLRIELELRNGGDRGALLKSGDGVLELTHANSDYTQTVYVTNGTLKLGGANGQAGSGTITVDSVADSTDASPEAILELAHSEAATTTNRIDLKGDAILKVTGSQETIGVDSSLLGTVALSHTLLNNVAITVGATTRFDLTNWVGDKSGAITLISGGILQGYGDLNTSNITGWGENRNAVFSWVGGKLMLSETAISSNVYWNSTSTTWTSDTTYSNGTESDITATENDTIVFNTGTKTTLSLGSDIANHVRITGNEPTQPGSTPTGSTLQLTMGNYNLTGEVTVDSGSTLEINDMAFSDGDHFNKPLWNGKGTIILKGKTLQPPSDQTTNHAGHISLVNFNGTVQVSGKFDLASSEIGSSGKWKLINGQSWSSVNKMIDNEVEVEDFVLRPDTTYTFARKVTGESVTIGDADNNSTVKFSDAASSIKKVKVVRGTVEYNGTATGRNTLFTGDTYLEGETNMLLTPSDTGKAYSATDARQYKGAVYMNGNVVDQNGDILTKITFADGSMNITGGLHIGEANSPKYGKLVVCWDKNQFINGLYGSGALQITRINPTNSNSVNCNGRTGYIVLTGSSNFVGNLNIGNTMSSNPTDTSLKTDYNFGMIVLGESNSATALQNTIVNFDLTAPKKNALVFTTSESIVDGNTWFTGTNFQDAANGKLAGLSGGMGAVFAKELTLRGSDANDRLFGGELFIKKLIVDKAGTGKQTLAGASGYRYNMAVEVKNGTLAFSGNADVTDLTLTSNLEVNGGDVTIGSTTGSGTLKATAGSVTLKNGTHVLGTLDMSNDSTATVTVQSGGSLQATTLRSSQNSSITLEDGASFIASDAVTIGGEASDTDADKSKVQATAAADYSIDSDQYTISNATVTVTADATEHTAIANKLLGSALINNGNVTVTATNRGNDLTKIEANGGNINLQNVGTTTPEELHSLVIGAGKTVSAHTDTSSLESVENEATFTVSDVATFGQGATLNANLELKTGVMLTLDGALQMGSTLKLNERMTLDGGLLTELNSLRVGETVDLFTGVDTLTLGGDSYTKGTNILSKADRIDLNRYFSNVQAGNYVLGYNAGTVYAESLVPEPATVTLGLLALAGLCARRRRQ